MTNFGKFFTSKEFACSHCGRVEMDQAFVDKLNTLRANVGFPLKVTSGYRCSEHPVEAKKSATGAHTTGKAADFGVQGALAHALLTEAMKLGFKGIGVQQKGGGRFIHLDDWDNENRPTVWSY